jgi:uncharacterized membrane protein
MIEWMFVSGIKIWLLVLLWRTILGSRDVDICLLGWEFPNTVAIQDGNF